MVDDGTLLLEEDDPVFFSADLVGFSMDFAIGLSTFFDFFAGGMGAEVAVVAAVIRKFSGQNSPV